MTAALIITGLAILVIDISDLRVTGASLVAVVLLVWGLRRAGVFTAAFWAADDPTDDLSRLDRMDRERWGRSVEPFKDER